MVAALQNNTLLLWQAIVNCIILWCVISIKLNISQKITGFVLWRVISMKLNIGQKITRLEIITFTCKKNLACFQTGKTDVRAYSSSLLHTIIAGNHLPFLKIYSNFSHFCPNFQIFCLFFNIFLPFFWKIAFIPLHSRISSGCLRACHTVYRDFLEGRKVG